jgi:hypothetical protein
MPKVVKERREVVSFRVSQEIRALLENLLVKLITKRQERCTLTDVIEEALREKAKREGVACHR